MTLMSFENGGTLLLCIYRKKVQVFVHLCQVGYQWLIKSISENSHSEKYFYFISGFLLSTINSNDK